MDRTPWSDELGLCGLADGVADRVERTHAIGNGQVPAVVRLAWETLIGTSMHNTRFICRMFLRSDAIGS